MQLNVLLFASYAEAFGKPSVSVTLPDGASVDDLMSKVRAIAGPAELPPAAVAVNQEYVDKAYCLAPGDEVAIIPPVAGG